MLDRVPHIRFAQGDCHSALNIDPFGNRVDMRPRDQRPRRTVFAVVLAVAQPTPHIEHITKAAGCQKSGLGSFSSQDGIGRNSRPMDDDADATEEIR